MMKRHSGLRRKRAQALAEMALMVPFLVIGMMGFLDLGRAFYFQISLTNSVREGARFAALPQYTGIFPDCSGATPPDYTPPATCPTPSDADICARVRQELTNTGFTVNCSQVKVIPDQQGRAANFNSGTQTVGYQLTVQGSYKFSFITPIIGQLVGDANGQLTLNTSAVFRTEY